MAYGYLGQNTPNQTVNNSGVFSITDSANLQSQGKLGGSLELIEEQTVTGSGAVYIDFTDIKENKYDTHLVTWNNAQPLSDSKVLTMRFSDDGGSTFETSNYDFAFQNINATGSFNFNYSTGGTFMYCSTSVGTGTSETANGYAYLYNLGNSSKYSYNTWHSSDLQAAPVLQSFFGSQVYHIASTINGLRLGTSDGSSHWTGNFKVFGVKQWVT